MSQQNKSFVFIVAFLIFACVFSWGLYYRTYAAKDTVNIKNFPLSFGDWQGEELPISEEDIAILETRNVFVRRYTNPSGVKIVLFVVYSQNNRKVSHPPEICYTGGGMTVVDSARDHVDVGNGRLVEANRLVVDGKGSLQEVLLYWFKVGNSFTANYWKQQGLIAIKSFLGQPSSSALVRISTRIDGEGQSKGLTELKEFARQIFPLIQQHLP